MSIAEKIPENFEIAQAS